MSEAACSACETPVGARSGARLSAPEAGRHAVFCRLAHLVAWAEGSGSWRPGVLLDRDDDGDGLGRCAQCGDRPGHDRVLLVRHGGPLRIGDAFCDLEHAAIWAAAGPR